MVSIKKVEILFLSLLKTINGVTSKTIKIKFKTFKFNNETNRKKFNLSNYQNNEEKKENYFYYDLILNNIYSEIFIGSPSQKIIGFYSGKSEIFSLISDKCFLEDSKYDLSLSKTFRKISNFNFSYKKYENCFYAQENFEFESYNKNDKIFFDNLKFFLTNAYNKSKNTCALIGLRLNYQDMFIENPKNFIFYLMNYFNINKEKKLSSYYWLIKYENSNEGYISIGEPPHIYDLNNYKNKKFNEFNIEAKYSEVNWAIQFNQIFLNKSNEIIFLKKYFEGHNCVFYPEFNIILSTVDYFNTIKKEFFMKFFDKKICFIKKTFISNINSTIIDGLNGEYILFYCDKNKLIEYGLNKFYSEFPSLNFYHSLFNYTFTLNATDLFYEDYLNNKLYFLIGNKNNDVDQWIFGKIFMNKFQFVFNSEMKTIGYYTQINKHLKNEKYFEIKYLKILIIVIIMVVVFSCFWIFSYKKRNIFNKDKKDKALEMKLI